MQDFLTEAVSVRAVTASPELQLDWLRYVPADAELRLVLLDERGPAEPQLLTSDLVTRLLDHAGARSGPRARGAAELVRRSAAGTARVVSARPSILGAPDGTIEVRSRSAKAVLLQQRSEVDGQKVVRCHVFAGEGDSRHIGQVSEELNVLMGEKAALPAEGARVATRALVPVDLRPYQRAAIEAWEHAGGRGILAMATGTGKTETALAAVNDSATDGLVTVVLAPLTHLVDQWVDRCRAAGGRAIACHSSSSSWAPQAQQEVDLVRIGVRKRTTLVATYATASMDPFRAMVTDLRPERFLLIADEAHNLGSTGASAVLFANAGRRLGLSATPTRWGDADGNERLDTYFGGTVFEYSLGRAIADGVLTPYRYELADYELSGDELHAFRTASEEYRRLLAPDRSRNGGEVEVARLRRLEALDGAVGKLEALRRLLRLHRPDRTIAYCADREQLDAVLALSWNEGFKAHPFTGDEPAGERRRILDRFASGDIPLLGAIRCLDEGVDVPQAREAYLLRSSGNPAQYIQRRGRLLRRSPGKEFAVIRDLVAVNGPVEVADVEEARVREFATVAMNGDEVLEHSHRLLRRDA